MSADRDLSASLDWTSAGTALFLDAVARLPDAALNERTDLPTWSRRHVVAHVAANADALINLARWATSGVETPMYASMDQRDADIAAGARQPADELREWARRSADRLADALDAIPSNRWQFEVRTAQGRLVPATEIPWLRAREVMVHAIDLGSNIEFDDLPRRFLLALIDEVVVRRSTPANPALTLIDDADGRAWTIGGNGQPLEARGSAGAIAALLTGRRSGTKGPDIDLPVTLPPWL